ncbi:MFS multidrug transporter [Phlyctema vagabunda]|uniref:MFS multidrug transporter n=1 Tax=Phlyctema vagabunda TaxID=108571 RepID=A0ABR4PZ25_9HELO
MSSSITEAGEYDTLLPQGQPDRKSRRRRTLAIVTLCISIVTAVDFGFFLVLIPLTRVYEIIICFNYYSSVDPGIIGPGGFIAEKLCKVEPVQSELAFVRGYEVFFMSLPSVILAVPYGMMADKWGRKPVLLLSIFGMILAITFMMMVCWFSESFPLRFVWISWSFNIIGGGPAVAMAMVLTIAADVVAEKQRATVFFQVAVGALLAQTFATLLASAFMERSEPWTSIFVGYIIGVAACCIAFFIPETLKYKNQTEDGPIDGMEIRDCLDRSDSDVVWKGALQKFHVVVQETWAIVIQDWRLFALLITFFINSISTALSSIILQYISARYDWTVAQAGFLLSLRSGANVVLFVLILPFFTWMLSTKFELGSQRKDLWLARVSILFLPTGFIMIGLAQTPGVAGLGLMITTLGTGYSSLVRSLVTSMTEPHHVARLYTAVTVFDTLGSLISGPILAVLYQWGMRLGGGWIGMPFFVAGILTGLTAVLLWLVNISNVLSGVEMAI